MKIGYYPGCSLQSTAREYDRSLRAVAAKIGIELLELHDWNCCGASSAHVLDPVLAVSLPARNLIIAEEMGLDILVPCAACFLRFKQAQQRLSQDLKLRKEVESAIGKSYTGSEKVFHPLTVLSETAIRKEIENAIAKKLKGFRVVCYYGCYLVRPPETTCFDDPENPTVMDELVALTGAEVLDWAWKVDCCGAGHSLLRPGLVESLVGEITYWARKAGARAIIAACPLCQINLQMRQQEKNGLPVLYFSELLGLAMGIENFRSRRIQGRTIDNRGWLGA